MIIFRNIGSTYETTSRVTGQEHLEGMIEVSVIPPDNLENPEFGNDEFYNLDLVMIESDKPYKLCGKRLQWDKALWEITNVRLIDKTTRELFIKRIKDL